MKCHHRILRHKDAGIFRFQRKFYFFSKQKSRIGDAIAHLHKVFDRHVGDGVGIRFSRLLELLEDAFPIAPMPIQQLEQDRAVFESAIDSLPKERDDRMRGIAE